MSDQQALRDWQALILNQQYISIACMRQAFFTSQQAKHAGLGRRPLKGVHVLAGQLLPSLVHLATGETCCGWWPQEP